MGEKGFIKCFKERGGNTLTLLRFTRNKKPSSWLEEEGGQRVTHQSSFQHREGGGVVIRHEEKEVSQSTSSFIYGYDPLSSSTAVY